MSAIPLLSLRIGMDPDLVSIGNFVLTWHGFLSFIAVAIAVFLVIRWSRNEGLVTDSIWTVATWCIVGGIIGSRALHVIDFWSDIYRHDPIRMVQIWQGGITIYGAILGGFLTGAAYMLIRNNQRFLDSWNKVFRTNLGRAPLPSVGRLADICVPALLLAMAVGRVGDIINGEHVAKLTALPWGVIYSHPESPSNFAHGLLSSHPAVAYELLWDLLVLAMILPLRNRLRPNGMLFALYLALYSGGKFFITFLRLDSGEWAIGLREAHFVAIIVLAITIPILLSKARFVTPPRVRRRTTVTRDSEDSNSTIQA